MQQLIGEAPSGPGLTSPPIVATKVRTPAPIPGVAERSRLSARLDRALDDACRLTLLSAPPGYGKTVAVVGWLDSRCIPAAWLSLDAADNDLARFGRYLAAALGAVRPGAGDGTLRLFGPGANPSPDLVGATLVDELATADDPFVLVLDDYHAIEAGPIHALVRFLIERGPPFAHVVLVTREDPPLPLARLRAHGRLVELRAEDLRFTIDEAVALLARTNAELGPEHVGRLVDRTEGWVAGLQLAAISLAGRPDAGALIDAFGGSHRFVLDYLADEVVDGLDADLRSFLVQTSVAERFTADLCRELTGRDEAEALLHRAERANLFLVPLDLERRWYRYHRLFADYLRSRLDEGDRRALHERAAAWFEGAGLAQEAISHALLAASPDRALRLVASEARRAFEAGELLTLLAWLEALPADLVATDGELVSIQAWTLFHTGRLASAIACAERRLAAPVARGPAEGRLLALRALLETVAGPDAEALASAALDLLGDDAFFRSLAFQAAGLAQLARGDLVDAVVSVRAALDAALQAGHPMVVLPAVNPLVHAYNAAGRRTEAETICREVLARHADRQGRPLAIAWHARVALGILRYEANDLVEARRELEAGFAAAAALGIGRPVLGWAVPYLALVRLACGEPEAALEALRVSNRDVEAAGMALPGLSGETEARVLLAQGNVASAARWADGARPEAPEDSPLMTLLVVSLEVSVARVRLAQGRHADAGSLLARARAYQERHAGLTDLISIAILQATAAEATGRRAEAQRLLEDAVLRAAPGGYVRRFLDDGRSIAHLLPFVRKASPAFVDELVAGFAAESPAGRAQAGAAPIGGGPSVWRTATGELLDTLTARELDVLRLVARGASNAEIAGDLAVSIGTAKWHVGNVLAKLGVTSRTQALVRAQQLGLV